MKCISKTICIVLSVSMILTGCGLESAELFKPYDMYDVTASGNAALTHNPSGTYFASNLCVVDDKDVLNKKVDPSHVKSAAAFNITTGETLYAYKALNKRYPASTTKVMTAMLVLKYGNLDDKVIVSKKAVTLPSGAASVGLREGDEVSVRGLLYGLLLVSGNDAAIALAEYVSGSVEAFAKLMTQEARALGATKTNFVNPNGIHNKEHYTSAYDLYLIFQEAIKDEQFLKFIKTSSAKVKVTHSDGSSAVVTYETTNRFISGEVQCPSEYVVLGGKTGTTYNAGKCLIILTENKKKEKIVFVALGADTRERLYQFLNTLMSGVSETK